MDKREQLILELRKIQENQYQVTAGQNQWELVLAMLDYIGDIDPVLRDDLIYNTLSKWLEGAACFDEEQLRHILNMLMDENHLFYHLGNDEDHSVLTRTFSALGVVLVLIRHRKKAFLNAEEFTEIKNRLIGYYTSETDLRGYIQELGWAHGAAHGADVMDELVQCGESSAEVLEEILDAFKKVMDNGKYVFHNEEDERITRVVFRIIKDKRLPEQRIRKWLEGLCECLEWPRDRKQYVARVNAKNFIRCLYFKLMHYDHAVDILNEVFRVEEKLNRFLLVDQELIEKI